MAGGIIIVVLLLIMPVVIIMTMVVLAGALGSLVKDDVDSGFADSEFLELGK
jgi:hypothetical protein